MRFSVIGADKDTGDDVDVVLNASSREVAEADALKKGILVSTIKELPEEKDTIELVSDEGPEKDDGGWQVGKGPSTATAPAKEKHANGFITLSANSPSESAYTGEAGQRKAEEDKGGMEYHVIMNQALYLLETAVNKYLKDGWKPAGGLTVGISNNALQYFQAVVRERQPGQAEAKH
jgi:hypothetical protein